MLILSGAEGKGLLSRVSMTLGARQVQSLSSIIHEAGHQTRVESLLPITPDVTVLMQQFKASCETAMSSSGKLYR